MSWVMDAWRRTIETALRQSEQTGERYRIKSVRDVNTGEVIGWLYSTTKQKYRKPIGKVGW